MATPIDDYFAEKSAAVRQRKEHELQLWQTWKDGGERPEHLAPLIKLYEPIIGQKLRSWRPKAIPESAFKAELQTHLIKAFQTYDPARGAALNTHVEHRLPKALRYMNRHQNTMYIPEGPAGFIGAIDRAHDALSEELGRAPSSQEIHDHLLKDEDRDYRKLTPKKIDQIQAQRVRDIPMSISGGPESYDYAAGTEPTGHAFEDQEIAVAQNILPQLFPNKPEMHALFHHTFGTNGHEKITSTGALAKKMGKSQSQISRMKTQMGATLKKYMGQQDDEE